MAESTEVPSKLLAGQYVDYFVNSVYANNILKLDYMSGPTKVQFVRWEQGKNRMNEVKCIIHEDGSIQGHPHDFTEKDAVGYECILNLAKRYAEMEKAVYKWKKEYDELSKVAIALDDVLTKKLDKDVQKKYDDLVAKELERMVSNKANTGPATVARYFSNEWVQKNMIKNKSTAFNAIQSINRNGMHATLESVIDNGNLAKTP